MGDQNQLQLAPFASLGSAVVIRHFELKYGAIFGRLLNENESRLVQQGARDKEIIVAKRYVAVSVQL